MQWVAYKLPQSTPPPFFSYGERSYFILLPNEKKKQEILSCFPITLLQEKYEKNANRRSTSWNSMTLDAHILIICITYALHVESAWELKAARAVFPYERSGAIFRFTRLRKEIVSHSKFCSKILIFERVCLHEKLFKLYFRGYWNFMRLEPHILESLQI